LPASKSSDDRLQQVEVDLERLATRVAALEKHVEPPETMDARRIRDLKARLKMDDLTAKIRNKEIDDRIQRSAQQAGGSVERGSCSSGDRLERLIRHPRRNGCDGDSMRRGRTSSKRARLATRAFELRREYDFSKGVRGKYAKRYAEGTKAVLVDPDVVAAFPDSEAVNRALRSIIAARQKRRRRES